MDDTYDFRSDKERFPDPPLFDAGMAGKQIGSKFNFNDYNPLVRGYTVMPKAMICKGCQKQCSFSPFSVITYMNRKMILEGYCDMCVQTKIIEGKQKLAEWNEKNDKKEREKKMDMAKRLLVREEDEKKKANRKKSDPLNQDKANPG